MIKFYDAPHDVKQSLRDYLFSYFFPQPIISDAICDRILKYDKKILAL